MWKWFKMLFCEDPIAREEIEERIKAAVEESGLQTMQKLDVKDGDIVVLNYPYKLSERTSIHLRDAVEEIIKGYGFDVHVMVFEEGMTIGILRKEGL